jgi:hypothetical protein
VYFGFDATRFSRLIADWSVKDMNPDLTPLIVIVSREKKKDTTSNFIEIDLNNDLAKFVYNINNINPNC